MAYAIRPFHTDDALELAELTLAAIRAVGSVSYSPEQVEAWAARHPGPQRFISRAAAGASIFVAVDSRDCGVAYALIEPDGHLDMLYCHPEHTRRGLADLLLAEAEEHARATGCDRLYTEASELARPSFERAGYIVEHRRDFEVEGVSIHNYAMVKPLK
ncbi:MAG: GNAT family N-acetyltransferase [Pseudomonadota bacterium]